MSVFALHTKCCRILFNCSTQASSQPSALVFNEFKLRDLAMNVRDEMEGNKLAGYLSFEVQQINLSAIRGSVVLSIMVVSSGLLLIPQPFYF